MASDNAMNLWVVSGGMGFRPVATNETGYVDPDLAGHAAGQQMIAVGDPGFGFVNASDYPLPGAQQQVTWLNAAGVPVGTSTIQSVASVPSGQAMPMWVWVALAIGVIVILLWLLQGKKKG